VPHIERLFHLSVCLHKFVKSVTSSVPVRTFSIEQMFVSVRMQFHNHVDTQPVKRFDRAMRCIYNIKFGMLQVRKNEIPLRKCSGGSALLRTSQGTLVTRESARFDNNDSEPKSQVSLRKSPEKNLNFSKTHIVESNLYFPNVRMRMNVFLRRGNCSR